MEAHSTFDAGTTIIKWNKSFHGKPSYKYVTFDSLFEENDEFFNRIRLGRLGLVHETFKISKVCLFLCFDKPSLISNGHKRWKY